MWDRGAGSRSIDRFESGAWRRGALLFHFIPERDEARVQFRFRCIFSPVARAHDQVDTRQLMLVQPERLADDPADTVALDTAAGGTNRNGKTETRPTLVVQERSHTKESIAKASPASVGRIKVRLATQPPLRGKSKPCWGRAVAGQGAIVLSTSVLSMGTPQPRASNRGSHSPGRPAACIQRADTAARCRHKSRVCPRTRRVAGSAQPSTQREVHNTQPERVTARNKRRGFCHALWDELSTALGAAACQNGAAILSSHTCTEPVRARPPHFARLIGALHCMDSVYGPSVSKRAARLSR
jgi:hypothetical protein